MQVKKCSFIILIILTNFALKCRGLPADFCDGAEFIEFFPHPESCIKYVLCILGTPNVIDCESNHIFTPETKRCEPGYPETCELFTPSVRTSTTTTVTQTEPEPTTNNPTDSSTIPVDSTTDQISTTSTTDQLPTTKEETTSEDLTSISNTDSTIIPETSTETTSESFLTSGISITTTSRLTTATSTAAPIHRCPPGGNGYIPHHTNCSRYFECISGIRHLRFCHHELLFDSVTLRCTYPELAVCAGNK